VFRSLRCPCCRNRCVRGCSIRVHFKANIPAMPIIWIARPPQNLSDTSVQSHHTAIANASTDHSRQDSPKCPLRPGVLRAPSRRDGCRGMIAVGSRGLEDVAKGPCISSAAFGNEAKRGMSDALAVALGVEQNLAGRSWRLKRTAQKGAGCSHFAIQDPGLCGWSDTPLRAGASRSSAVRAPHGDDKSSGAVQAPLL